MKRNYRKTQTLIAMSFVAVLFAQLLFMPGCGFTPDQTLIYAFGSTGMCWALCAWIAYIDHRYWKKQAERSQKFHDEHRKKIIQSLNQMDL